MKYLKLFAAAFLLSSPGFAQDADYFPLQVGNQWVYKVTGPAGSNPFTVEVAGTETIGGNEYFSVIGFPGHALLLRKNDEGTLVFYDREENREKTWVAFGAAAGQAFRTEVDPCNAAAVIWTRQGELKSPFGEFSNAQDYDLILRNEKGEAVYRWALGKFFTDIFRQFPLMGEKNWVLTVPVPDVPPGNYAATANLAVAGPRYEAVIPFAIVAR
ncbi:MAG: hypothetical protein LC126_04315 [Bryobacterales bacterium]|nr:hypothetical protein [Bryobacterales bacterium]